MKSMCDKCGKPLGEYFRTAYGESRCSNCYDDYLMTDRGKVEYLLGILKGELSMDDFDADFLAHVSVCWKKYRSEFIMPFCDLKTFEEKAIILGLL